jgi:outer membrane protein assembly factor BamB
MRTGRATFSVGAAMAIALLVASPAFAVTSGPTRSVPNITLAAAPVQRLAPGGNFSTYLGNVGRTSASLTELIVNQSTASDIHLLWSYSTGSSVETQPVVQNGTVFFGAEDGYEYALDTASGALLWRTFLGQDSSDSGCGDNVLGVSSTASYYGGKLYVDGGSPNLYALNTSTGVIGWRTTVSGPGSAGYYDWSSPLLYKGNAYVGLSSDCGSPPVPSALEQFSLKTTNLTASFNSSRAANGSSIRGAPAINAPTNTIYVATGSASAGTTKYSDSVVALNATTLAPSLSYYQVPVGSQGPWTGFSDTPTIDDPTVGVPMVFVTSGTGTVFGLNQSDLSRAWGTSICCANGDTDNSSLALGGGDLYAVTPAAVGPRGAVFNSTVRELNPLDGHSIWVRGFSESDLESDAAPLYVNGVLVVPDGNSLLFLNATSGGLLAQFNDTGQFAGPPSVSRGEVYASSTNGDVYAFDVLLNSTVSQSTPTGVGFLTDTFDATASGGLPPYTYLWSFGDGATSNLPDPLETYSTPGAYDVNVTVTDLAGNVSTHHLTVSVFQGPPASSPKPMGFLGLPKDLGYVIVAVIVSLVVLIALLLLLRRRNAPRKPVSASASRPVPGSNGLGASTSRTGSLSGSPPPGAPGP